MPGTNRIVALCTSRVYDPQVHAYIESFNECLKKQGLRMIVYALNADIYWSEEEPSAESAVFDYVPYERIDALVIMDEKIKSRRIAGALIEKALQRDIPVIVVDGSYQRTVSINFDYVPAFEKIVRHVIEEHGVKKLHLLAGIQGNRFSAEREDAFRRVLAEYGLPYDEQSISYGEFWASPAREAVRCLLQREELPEALICCNDIMAINACDVLREAGIDVPGDMIVTGFDGYDEAFLSVPGITTANCEIAELAGTTAQAVVASINGSASAEYHVEPRVITNESCGCERALEFPNRLTINRFNTGFYRFQDDIREIHDITSAMLTAQSVGEAISLLRCKFTEHVACVVNSDCFVSGSNYFLTKHKDNKYYLIVNGTEEVKEPVPFSPSDVIPHLEERLDTGYPLIVQALDFMGRVMGYACYFFETYDITEYSKTPNITDMVNSGLGGYLNMRYQQYLLSKVEEMYKMDGLTGLYNRMAFHEAFEEMKKKPENDGIPLTVVMADLDHLKMINDEYGHEAGDHAIASVAVAMKTTCPENSLCVRFGGDEMLAFIPGPCAVNRILAEIGKKLIIAGKSLGYEVSASCGTYSTTLTPGMNFEDAVRKADEQMYKMKKKKKRHL